MFDWVVYRSPKNENFQSEAKVEQTIAIITTRCVYCLEIDLWMFSESSRVFYTIVIFERILNVVHDKVFL